MSARKRRDPPSPDPRVTPEQPRKFEGPAELRHRAEERLRLWKRGENAAAGAQRAFHELEVHQIELEMQNAELHTARNDLEAALERYSDLYNFAPVGYLTVDAAGVILEANLTGATLLGIERSRLINRKLSLFAASTSRPSVLAFLKSASAGSADQAFDARIRKDNGDTFWAGFRARAVVSPTATRPTWHMTFEDITARVEAAERQRDLLALTDTNVALKREIDRRIEAETVLRQSEDQKTRLLEKSQEMQTQLRLMSHQVLHAQEEERKRISRELHDEIAQTLVGINVHLAALSSGAAGKPEDNKKKIVRTQRLVEKAVERVHRFARELRPAALDHLGLVPALQALTKEFASLTGVHVRFTAPAARRTEPLGSAGSTALYRVAQEALTNVARHAQASVVHVTVEILVDVIRMSVRDNGKPFQVDQVAHAKRFARLGLIGMRERIEMVAGTFNVESAPGQGTTVTAEVPFGKTR